MNDRRYDNHNQHWLTHYNVCVFKMIHYFRHFDMVENLLQRRRSRKWDELEKKLAGNWRERKSTKETFEKKLGRTITVKEFRRWKLEVWSGHWKGVVWGKRRELVEWEERGNGIKLKWRTEQETHSEILGWELGEVEVEVTKRSWRAIMKGRAAVLQAVFVFLPPCLRCFFLTVVIITIKPCVKTTNTSSQAPSSYRKIQVVLVFESNRLGGAYRNRLKYELGVEVWGTPISSLTN